MASNALQSAYTNWQKRVQKYQAAGIPQSVWAPIANEYLNKVYTQGSADATNEQADAAVFAAVRGINPIEPTKPVHHGVFGFLGNALADAGNIITSLPRAVVQLGKDVVDPSEYAKTGHALSQALADVGSDPGKALRDLASSNQLDLIPGLTDAADLTTAQGREHLLTHPISGVLDVLPITKSLTAGLSKGLGEATAGSALEAFQKGSPVQGVLRAVDRKLGTVDDPRLGMTVGRGQQAVRSALRNMQLDPLGRQASASMSRLTGKVAHEVKPALERYEQMFGAMSEPEQLAFTRKAQLDDTGSMSPQERTLYNDLRSIRAEAEQHAKAQEGMTDAPGYEGKGLLIPGDSKIMQNFRSRDRKAATHEKNTDEHARTAENVRRAQQRVEQVNARVVERQKQMADDAQRRIEAEHAKVEKAASRLPEGMQRQYLTRALDHLGAKVETERARMTAQVARTHAQSVFKANEGLRRAQQRHALATKTLEGSAKQLRKAGEKAHKSLLRKPPASLHPAIAEHMKAGAKATYLERLTGLTGMPEHELYTIQGIRDTIKEIDGGHYDSVMSKKELTALKADSAAYVLDLVKQGFHPMYVHDYADKERVYSISPYKTRDQTEAQFRERAFNPGNTTLNMKLALSREAINIAERRGMQEFVDSYAPNLIRFADVMPGYRRMAAAKIAKGRGGGLGEEELARSLLNKDFRVFDFAQHGIKRPSSIKHNDDLLVDAAVAHNLEVFAGQRGKTDAIFNNRVYRGGMKVFRTSVLWGPRHFAHVVIGGLAPVLLDDPMAIKDMPGLVGPVWKALKGDDTHLLAKGVPQNVIDTLHLHFDYSTDAGGKWWQQKVGEKQSSLLKQFWEHTGKPLDEGMKNVEQFAGNLYQATVALRDINKGVDPMVALEHMRRLVVNTDDMAPFERTVLKQVFPFYSFTRFATKFLVQLPFDHPLRVSILASLSNQAQQEWGSGLPLTMMSLFFMGHPDANGNIKTINLRNANPFRSLSSSFTLGGFISNLNPALSVPFIAAGMNPLDGSTPMHPEIVFDPVTGTLKTERPKGDLALAFEQFIPELKAVDYFTGWSDSMRISKASDPGSFARQMTNTFNIPFTYSTYNLPQVRGRQATEALASAQQAMVDFRNGADYANSIGQYALLPYQGRLVTPAQFRAFWEAETAMAAQRFPGANVRSVIPTPNLPPANVLQELMRAYQ